MSEEMLFSDGDQAPSMRWAREIPHNHCCPIHGYWWHCDPECEDRSDAPCPDEYGQACTTEREFVR